MAEAMAALMPTTVPTPPGEAVAPHIESTAAPMTPPATDESSKGRGSNASELSELDMVDEEDEEDIKPDHYYDDGRVPVFKPTMDQFRSFKKFVEKIDKYGMRSGIIKIVPPKEWLDSLPALDEAVKTIRIKNPITQEFGGAHGTYTQANIEKQRSYNLPQWKALTEESQHQPPARRGEKRLNQEKPGRSTPKASVDSPLPHEQPRRGRPSRKSQLSTIETPPVDTFETPPVEEYDIVKEEPAKEIDVPPTPCSPTTAIPAPEKKKSGRPRLFESQGKTIAANGDKRSSTLKSKGSQAKSVAERRKYNQADTTKQVDEAAFKGFDYRFQYKDDFTKERCAELEEKYWKSLNFAPPMYGGDMPGSLFDEFTTSWNVAKLENLLDVLGQRIPGVNTTYLYLGMWKATFAWHLEDVDLYSINYIHFGAPKQWYSISQEDARRFENAMKSIWPNDAKSCSQFLRHKTYLISPDLLQKQFNIKVNKLVHYEGEFVITFPYGYHSGYNLGYNCAESVNFATESWLDYGRIAKKCDCEADSVWVDVGEIERKLRGEPTPEYEEYTDDEDDLDDRADHLPSPPASIRGKGKGTNKKRKRAADTLADKKPVKKLKIRIRTSTFQPCTLCPNHVPNEPLHATDNGKQAHRCCAEYTPETYIVDEGDKQTIRNIANIDKARLELKCNFCRQKTGSCFQCSSRKCIRAYHATCAAAAGVQIEHGPVAIYGEDGTEYSGEGWDFRCKFHRPKRLKNITTENLENNSFIRRHAAGTKIGDTIQVQYLAGEVFAGTVVENRHGERTFVIDVLPDGDRIEIEWRYLVVLGPQDSQLPKPSPDAQRLPESMQRHLISDRNAEFGPPQEGDSFTDASSMNKWAEFVTAHAPHNREQVKVDLSKPNVLWHYLGRLSTDAKPQYGDAPNSKCQNPMSNYLNTVKHIVEPVQAVRIKAPAHSYAPSRTISNPNWHSLNAVSHQLTPQVDTKQQRSYGYKSQNEFVQMTPYLQQQYRSMARSNLTLNSNSFLHNPYASNQNNPQFSQQARTSTSFQAQPSQSTQPRSGITQSPAPGTHQRTTSTVGKAGREERLARYPYLQQAVNGRIIGPPERRHWRSYRSPYSTAGGFSQQYAHFLTQTNLPQLHGSGTPAFSFSSSSAARLISSFNPVTPVPNLRYYQTDAQFQQQMKRQAMHFHDPFEVLSSRATQVSDAPMGHQR